MGIVYMDGLVKWGEKEERVRFLVDSGATYTVLQRNVWERLGLTPKRTVELVLADGSTISRQLSEAIVELPPYGQYYTPVILGESEDENLLGAVTLEIFGLMLDPLKRVLRPIRAILK
ncbi:MAG: retroviral-like aspartic protease family protein [Thermoproteota archaeon]